MFSLWVFTHFLSFFFAQQCCSIAAHDCGLLSATRGWSIQIVGISPLGISSNIKDVLVQQRLQFCILAFWRFCVDWPAVWSGNCRMLCDFISINQMQLSHWHCINSIGLCIVFAHWNVLLSVWWSLMLFLYNWSVWFD